MVKDICVFDFDFLDKLLDNFAEISEIKRERISLDCISLSTGTKRWAAILNKTCEETNRQDFSEAYAKMSWVETDMIDDLILGYLLKHKIVKEDSCD